MGQLSLTMRLAGESGQDNVNSAGEIVAKACARSGLEVFTWKTFPAEIKGGHVIYQIRVSGEPVLSMGDELDVLLAFNDEAIEKNGSNLRQGGLLVLDPDACKKAERPAGVTIYEVPLTKLAKEHSVRKNVVAIGLATRLFGLPLDIVAGIMTERYGHRPGAAESNNKALELGYQYAVDNPVPQVIDFDVQQAAKADETQDRLILEGNQAIALGAVAAGMTKYFGYPITPASDIMETLASILPTFGGDVVQTEDEIAALAAAIGAGYAGARSMTASAGPGISLMAELVGLSSMTETPVVIVDVQRGGPSTGLPTKTEQSDLNLVVYGSHGEAPRVVITCADVADCFRQTVTAFNVAEKYQVPVFLLSDTSLATRVEAVKRPDLEWVKAERERMAPKQPQLLEDPMGAFPRYEDTEDGISPRSLPGQPGGMYLATGIEHNKFGFPTYTPENHRAMLNKRFRKLDQLEDDVVATTVWGDPQADIGIIAWGSPTGVVREAMAALNAKGYSVKVLQLHLVWPLPLKAIREFAANCKTIFTAELNHTGQLAALLRAHAMLDTISVNKADGMPFTVAEVVDSIEEVLKDGEDAGRLQRGA